VLNSRFILAYIAVLFINNQDTDKRKQDNYKGFVFNMSDQRGLTNKKLLISIRYAEYRCHNFRTWMTCSVHSCHW